MALFSPAPIPGRRCARPTNPSRSNVMPASCRRLIIGCLLVLGLNLCPVLSPPARSADEKTGTVDVVLDTRACWPWRSGDSRNSGAGRAPVCRRFRAARWRDTPVRRRLRDEAKARDLSNAAVSVMFSPAAQSADVALASAAVGHAPRLPVTAHNLAAALYLRQGRPASGPTPTQARRRTLWRFTATPCPSRPTAWRRG